MSIETAFKELPSDEQKIYLKANPNSKLKILCSEDSKETKFVTSVIACLESIGISKGYGINATKTNSIIVEPKSFTLYESELQKLLDTVKSNKLVLHLTYQKVVNFEFYASNSIKVTQKLNRTVLQDIIDEYK